MSHCRHTHHATKADKWTKAAMIGEGVASFISDGYWLGGLIDLAADLNDDGAGLSWYGLAIGATLSFIIASGTAYSHTMLNINHQDNTPEKTDALLADEEHAEHDHHEPHSHLSWPQKAALAGDYISHVGDIAGPITFVAKIASKGSLPTWGKALVECSATLFGGLASVANVRTCANSMRNLNEKKLEESRRSSILNC